MWNRMRFGSRPDLRGPLTQTVRVTAGRFGRPLTAAWSGQGWPPSTRCGETLGSSAEQGLWCRWQLQSYGFIMASTPVHCWALHTVQLSVGRCVVFTATVENEMLFMCNVFQCSPGLLMLALSAALCERSARDLHYTWRSSWPQSVL